MDPTTTTTVHEAFDVSKKLSFGGFALWGPICLAAIALGVAVLYLEKRQMKAKGDKTTGKVVGVVGRMGSGKSYFAVRMAYTRIMAGAQVVSNFTMNLPPELAGNWRRFEGWDHMDEYSNSVLIIDEAHQWAASSDHRSFPRVARRALSNGRKRGIDLYWISQHEDRVNRTLRDLTNMIYVCSSSFGGKFFSAKGYEPEKVRKKDAHIDRRGYRLDLKIANLYDTLEIMDADDDLVDGKPSSGRAPSSSSASAGAERERSDGLAVLAARTTPPVNGWASTNSTS